VLGVVDAVVLGVVVAVGGDVVVPDVAGAPEVVEAAGAGADVWAEPVAEVGAGVAAPPAPGVAEDGTGAGEALPVPPDAGPDGAPGLPPGVPGLAAGAPGFPPGAAVCGGCAARTTPEPPGATGGSGCWASLGLRSNGVPWPGVAQVPAYGQRTSQASAIVVRRRVRM